MRKAIGILLAVLLVVGLVGCKKAPVYSQPEQKAADETPQEIPAPEGPMVGILLPDMQWQDAGNILVRELTQLGYRAELVYADNDATRQAQQMEELIGKNPACLVITPVDSIALLETEKVAKEAGVPIVAFDRLLMETNAVSGFVTFDYEAFGAQIAQYIIEEKSLDTAAAENKSYTIEFFMGCTEDHSALLLHRGLMAQLQPYLDAGVLVCKSGRTAFADTYVLHADQELAKRKCLDLLQSSHQPDIICAASDVLAAGCAEAIKEMEYEGDPMILLTGQGGHIGAVQRIVNGKQTMTIYKDWEALSIQCAGVVDALISGQTPTWSDTEGFDNHVITVPAYVASGVMVDKENYKETIVDTKIYSLDALPIEE